MRRSFWRHFKRELKDLDAGESLVVFNFAGLSNLVTARFSTPALLGQFTVWAWPPKQYMPPVHPRGEGPYVITSEGVCRPWDL